MANSELLKLIAQSGLHRDDTIEIERIFEVLTDERKVEILNNWDQIAARIRASREQMEREKEILLVQALENIESDLAAYDKKVVGTSTAKDIESLKSKI